MKSFISFHIFRHWIDDVKIKTSIPLDQVIKKSCDPAQQIWKQAGWATQIHNKHLQSQALVSSWSHFLFQFSVYYYEVPERAENHPQCCWSGDGSASIHPGQKTQRRINLSPI